MLGISTYRTVTSIPPNVVPATPAQCKYSHFVYRLREDQVDTTFEPIQWVDVALVLQHDLLDGPLPPLVDLSGLLSLLVVADRDG